MAELFTLTDSKAIHVPATQTDQKKINCQGSSLYYKVTSDVSSGDSALTSGSSLTIAADYWIISAGTSKVLVDAAAPDVAAEDVTVADDLTVTDAITAVSGTFSGALDADAITGTSISVDGAAGIVASADGGKDTLSLSNTTANVGITIGADTNLYRSAASSLKTDDNLTVALTGRFEGTYLEAVQELYARSGGATQVKLGTVQTKAGIEFGTTSPANIYHSAADTLATDDSFVFVASASRLQFGHADQAQTTVGAAGGASALPATPTKFFKVKDASGTELVIPAYAAS